MSRELWQMEPSKGNVGKLVLVGSAAVFTATILIWLLSMLLTAGYQRLTRAWLMVQELRGVTQRRAPVILLDPHGQPVVVPELDVELRDDGPPRPPAVEEAAAPPPRPVEYNEDGSVRRTL